MILNVVLLFEKLIISEKNIIYISESVVYKQFAKNILFLFLLQQIRINNFDHNESDK